jgi:CspA family cold shock protein
MFYPDSREFPQHGGGGLQQVTGRKAGADKDYRGIRHHGETTAEIFLPATRICSHLTQRDGGMPACRFSSPYPSIHHSLKPVVVMETPTLSKGTVKWFNEKKGFGFIVDPLVQGDIFVHFSAIESEGFKTLTEGEQVAYELFTDDKGAKARKVQRLG